MHSVCVFSGSRSGARPAYVDAARALGSEIAARGVRLVYGGAAGGLMGAAADAALAAGGEVVGVVPSDLVPTEVAHQGLTDLRVVRTMHERKTLLAELADGFVSLTGGLGTLEELFEILAWSQLGLQSKPCALLEVERFWVPLLEFLDSTVAEGFVRPEHRGLVLTGTEVAPLLDLMETWVPPAAPRWLDR